MIGLKFTLSGKAAFFKKPDVNEKVYFTYNNIHRIALLGLLGAIIGLDGYKNYELFNKKTPDYPEFYKKLNTLKISIVPNNPKGYFPKKIQYFNNSTGFASKEEGGNLMVREQWLQEPSWTIYLMQGNTENDIWDNLCDYILNSKCVYEPYLGKNDFPAKIGNSTLIILEEGDFDHIDSIFYGSIDVLDDFEFIGAGLPFIFREISPVGLVKDENFYKFKRSIYTNYKIKTPEKFTLLSDKDKVLCFN